MYDLGKYIRTVRKSKGLTLKELGEGIVSSTFLSKFERGQFSITADKFLSLLARLNIGPYEFYNDFLALYKKNQHHFIERLNKAKREKNIHLVQQLINQEQADYKKDGHYRHLHNIIILKQLANQLINLDFDQKQIQQIVKYLSHIDEWTSYEIDLLTNAAFCLSADQLSFFANQFFRKMKDHSYNDVYNQKIYHFMINMINRFIELGDFYHAKQYTDKLEEKLLGTRYFYEINLVKYLHGLIAIKEGNIDEGKAMTKEAIELMNYFNHFEMTKYCQKKVNRILNE